MKIKYGSVFGNFKWNAESDVTDELVAVLAPLGALQIGQRSPSTAAEKEMAGYEKRPKGFNRAKEIPFSTANAEILAKHLRSMKVEVGRDKDEPIYAEITATVTVEEYTGAETAESVYKAEKEVYDRHEKADDLAEFATKVAYEGDTERVEGEAPREFLIAIRAYVKEQLKSL